MFCFSASITVKRKLFAYANSPASPLLVMIFLLSLPKKWKLPLRACLAPRARNARRVYANAAPRPLFQIAGLQFIFAHCTTRATVSRAFAAERSARLFHLSRSNAVANTRNANPNRAFDLLRFISSHTILFILPVEHYSFYQSNRTTGVFSLREKVDFGL